MDSNRLRHFVAVVDHGGFTAAAQAVYVSQPALSLAVKELEQVMAQGRALVERERPQLIVPEIEAIATPMLLQLEAEGHRVILTARAARLTMDREGIRRLAAEELGLPTSPYAFASSAAELAAAAGAIGYPCFVKPVMSSSGKGQSYVESADAIGAAWDYALAGGRVALDVCAP